LSPSRGLTASAYSLASASAQAGLTPRVSGRAWSAPTCASGKLAISAWVVVRSLAPSAANSFSSRFNAFTDRGSKAARRQRAKKSSTLAFTPLTAAAAASVFSPSGRILESPSAFFHHSAYAAASAKNWSTLAWETPSLPQVPFSPPRQSIMSLMTALVASSLAESAGTIPSPLNGWSAKVWAAPIASSIVISAVSVLPKTCRAKAAICLPSGAASLIAASRKVGEPLIRSSGFLSRPPAHLTAAISSGARTRPSLSVSIKARVAWSNSSPVVGQARATHNFWSS